MIKKGRSLKKVFSCIAVTLCVLISGLTVGASTVVDTTAPSAPTSIVWNHNTDQITLDWANCTDNIGVVGYTVTGYKITDGNSSYINKNVSYSGCTGIGLVTSEYYLYVSAYDAAGNRSAGTFIYIPAAKY